MPIPDRTYNQAEVDALIAGAVDQAAEEGGLAAHKFIDDLDDGQQLVGDELGDAVYDAIRLITTAAARLALEEREAAAEKRGYERGIEERK